MSKYAQILVTTDLSEASLPALDEAAKLARSLARSITLFYVVEDNLPPILGFSTEAQRRKVLESQAESAKVEMEKLAAERLAGCTVEIVTRVGIPETKIVEHAQELGFEMIVMSSHGYGPIRQLLLGSTTERVLHRARCPVLVVPVDRS